MRRGVAFALAAVLGLSPCLAACSGGSGGSGGGGSAAAQSGEPAEDAIKIEEIDYTVDLGIEDGNRRVMFEFTNNSAYEIVSLEIDCKIRDDATDDELKSSCDYILESGWTLEELRDSVITYQSYYRVGAGETSDPDPIFFGGYYATNEDQADIIEPDLMTIKFLSDGKLYTEYYDFKSQTYDLDSEVIDTTDWSDSDTAKMLPETDSLVVVATQETSEEFSFETTATTQGDFEEYVVACKEKGFTANVEKGDRTFRATTEDGAYSVDLYLYSWGELKGSVSSAAKAE